MFKSFADKVGKAHTQLMEGAITYSEFFNFCCARVGEVVVSDEFRKWADEHQDGDPMGASPENQ
jgi:hypothetical protein